MSRSATPSDIELDPIFAPAMSFDAFKQAFEQGGVFRYWLDVGGRKGISLMHACERSDETKAWSASVRDYVLSRGGYFLQRRFWASGGTEVCTEYLAVPPRQRGQEKGEA